MTILYMLIPLSLVLVAGAVWAFFWAVDSGQFDDLDEAARSVLADDDDHEAADPESGPRGRPAGQVAAVRRDPAPGD
jgi:cbb3-type cytochrome oxidase maturation protein